MNGAKMAVDDRYERITRRVVWYAETGATDGGGMGRWEETLTSEPFPTEDEAWEHLKHHPDVIPQRSRRDYRHRSPFGEVRVRRAEECEA